MCVERLGSDVIYPISQCQINLTNFLILLMPHDRILDQSNCVMQVCVWPDLKLYIYIYIYININIFKEVSSAHQACIYLITNTVKVVIV